ncbi:N-acetylmuramoyl-L-alanine amidase [Virgibacillus dakarensis]|nr:N-acetylmuramoyl-L-alanine amidase [Virgibacillus dakarensis]
MKNKLIIGIGFFICLFIFIPTVNAESGQLYKVETSTAELRAEPGQEAEIIAELEGGDDITVFQQSFGWGRTFYNGKEAWVALYKLTEIKEEKETTDTEKSAEKKADHEKVPGGTKMKPEDSDSPSSQVSVENNKTVKETKVDQDQSDSPAAAEAWDVANGAEGRLLSPVQIENKDKQKDQRDNKALAGHHVVIDPGHGGKDSGAIAQDVYEKTLTLATAKEVADKLHDEGASVTLTRTDDTFISLDERVQISTNHDTDAFISLHYNAFTKPAVKGISSYYYAGDNDQKLARSIQSSLTKNVGLHDRGVNQANFQVLRENSDPAVLIELGFISNPDERKTIQTAAYQKKAADAITSGLENYFTD